MDAKAVRASARRILELARTLPKYRQHDFIAEAACILKLTEPPDDTRGTRYDPEHRRRV